MDFWKARANVAEANLTQEKRNRGNEMRGMLRNKDIRIGELEEEVQRLERTVASQREKASVAHARAVAEGATITCLSNELASKSSQLEDARQENLKVLRKHAAAARTSAKQAAAQQTALAKDGQKPEPGALR